MAKERERAIAKILFIENNLTIKDGAERVGVTEKTFSNWVRAGSWTAERDARNASPAKRINNIKEIISNLSEEWLVLDRAVKELERNRAEPSEITDIRARIRGIDDAVSKWNKTLENIDKESRIPLATYLNIMEDVFSDLREFNKDIYLQTIDFQEHHINKVSIKIG